MNLPYLTANLPGIGGQLKAFPEDFVVEEVPLYPASGEGQHIYAIIEKRGISTYAAVKEMARALKIAPVSIGYAGLKDAHAITRQTVSISNVKEEAVRALNLPKIQVLHITRHRNKLKVGHLAGNRFVIRVRQVTEEALPAAQAVLDVLAAKGAPNYFGEQRFGLRRNTHRLGELLVRNNLAEFVPEYLGRPQEGEAEYIQVVRRLVDENRWAEALAQWPPNLSDEGRVLAALVKAEGRLDVVHRALDKKLRGLFVSAYQSELFNGLLVERLATFDQLEPGDVAYIHGKGASFVVEEAAVEQPRADRFEISPSGPLFGPKMLLAQGEPGRREQAVLAEQGLTPDDFSIEGFKVRGARRPYRLQIKNPQTGWDDGLVVSFELEPGAYATTVMAEIMKTG